MPVQRGPDDERLERGARLVGADQRAVAAKFRRGVVVLRVERRVVGQRQHFAGVRVHHHDFAVLCLKFLAGGGQFLLGEHLDVRVDGQDQVLAMLGGHVILGRHRDRAVLRVLGGADVAVAAAEELVELQFQPVEPAAVCWLPPRMCEAIEPIG